MAFQGDSSSEPGQSTGDANGNGNDITTDAKSHIPLKEFAEAIRGHASIPDKIFDIQKSGRAKVMIHKVDDEKWAAVIRSGDNYTRAIIETALNSIPANSKGRIELERSEHDTFYVTFTFLTKPTNSLDKTPYTLTVRGNEIAIEVVHFEDSESWKVAQKALTVVNPSAMAVNILGLAELTYDALKSKSDPRTNPDVLRLRDSPAFTKPIYSFKLK